MGFIFMPDNITAIIEGRKWKTRRIHKPGEVGITSRGNVVVGRHGKLWSDDVIDSVLTQPNRLKWQVGRTYAVSPGRGKPGVWWEPGGLVKGYWYDVAGPILKPSQWTSYGKGVKPEDITLDTLKANGYQPLRIRITQIRRERVQEISEADAIAEGWPDNEDKRECPHCDALYPTGWYDGPNLPCTCNPLTWYRLLWDSINTKKGTRWADNPEVWVLSFEVVK